MDRSQSKWILDFDLNGAIRLARYFQFVQIAWRWCSPSHVAEMTSGR